MESINILDNNNVKSWNVEDVSKWLESIELGVLVKSFKEKNVNGISLLEITQKDYDNLGISSIVGGKQIKFSKKISELINQHQTTLPQISDLKLVNQPQPQSPQQLQQITVQLDDYHVTSIGRGGFGEVYKLVHKVDSLNVKAMKKIPFLNNKSRMFKEVEILTKLKHENVIEIKSYQMDDHYLYLFFDYIQNSIGSVYRAKGAFLEINCRPIVEKILKGLDHIHSNNIAHRDLKCDNILLLPDGRTPLIIDFGLSLKFEGENSTFKTRAVGTPGWQSPEVRLGKSDSCGRSCDIWSLGCTIIEMLVAGDPWRKESLDKHAHPPIPSELSMYFKDFLNICFIIAPKFRSSAKELLQHPWILGEPDIIVPTTTTTTTVSVDKKGLTQQIIQQFKQFGAYYQSSNGLAFKYDFNDSLNTESILLCRPDRKMELLKLEKPLIYSKLESEFFSIVNEKMVIKIGKFQLNVDSSLKELYKKLDYCYICVYLLCEKEDVHVIDRLSLDPTLCHLTREQLKHQLSKQKTQTLFTYYLINEYPHFFFIL